MLGIKFSFRLKTVLGIVFIELLCLGSLLFYINDRTSDATAKELFHRADITANMFAASIKDAVIASDLATLDSLVQELQNQTDIVYVNVHHPLDQNIIFSSSGVAPHLESSEIDSNIDSVDDGVIDIRTKVSDLGYDFAVVDIGLSVRKQMLALAQTLRSSYLIAGLELVLATVFSILLGNYLAKNLQGLTKGAKEISKGNLGYTIPIQGNDEFSQTAKVFNHMSERLREQNIYKDAVLCSAPTAILTLDHKGFITDINPSAENLLNVYRQDVINQHINTVAVISFRNENYVLNPYSFPIEQHAYSLDRNIEGTVTLIDQLQIPIESTLVRIKRDGRNPFYTLFIRDLSEEKKADTLKKDFVSIVSHELRTPITAIQGSLSLLDNGVIDVKSEKGRELLTIATRNCGRLTNIVNDILDIQKIESGKMDYKLSKESMVEILEIAINENQALAKKSNVLLGHEIYTAHSTVLVDKFRILQVVNNLISNAIKFSPENELVSVHLKDQDDKVRLIVEDHGAGISPKDRKLVFEKFAQLDSVNTRKNGGTGLGLSICKAIIQAHNGHIDFISHPGIKTQFYFDLPVVESNQLSKAGSLLRY